MASSETNSVKSLVALRKENEELQEMINVLQVENFEYALKTNRIENIISNVEAVIHTNPKKLVDASANLYGILEVCKAVCPKSNMKSDKTISCTPKKSDLPSSNKAHRVKPHMVNGTVLYIPTINLTRVSDLEMQSKSKSGNESNTSLSQSRVEDITTESTETEAEPSTSESFTGDQQSVHVESLSEPSTSKSHSTVLSGTFQEVKIFLNQVNEDRPKEESRKSINLRRRSQSSTSLPKYRKRQM